MIPFTFEKYQLQITDKDNGACSTKIFPDGNPHESKAMKKECRKLYIITSDDEVYYVGEAHTSIKTRFQRGCTAYNRFKRTGKARSGYQGYKWLDKGKNPKRTLAVNVAIFGNKCDKNRDLIEAIEGELVFLVRKNTGDWTIYQNEIHFHHNVSGAKETAEKIYNLIGKK